MLTAVLIISVLNLALNIAAVLQRHETLKAHKTRKDY